MTVVVVGAGGWLGHPIATSLNARRLPYTIIAEAGRSTHAASRLVDELRPDESTVVVNVSGLRWGSIDELLDANALIPAVLAKVLAPTGAHLVHVGSAAEYGYSGGGRTLNEGTGCVPTSDYGLSRLSGTEAVLADMPTATVLRPFNVIDSELPGGSPLVDVRERIDRATKDNGTVELLAAGTIRDYVSRDFVVRSVGNAARLRLPGIYNICSGAGIGTGQIVRMVLSDRGWTSEITSTDATLATRVVGDPKRWRDATGLSENLTCRGVVDMLGWLRPTRAGREYLS